MTKRGGDAAHKTSFGPDSEVLLSPLAFLVLRSGGCAQEEDHSMCGIVGYVGNERCVEVLMEGLRHLEYRGYDSAGLAVQASGGIEAIKKVGPLENLIGSLRTRNGALVGARTGVGHTRWATHGRPSEANAHPHLGGGRTVAVVHNGIIENYLELREELEGRGPQAQPAGRGFGRWGELLGQRGPGAAWLHPPLLGGGERRDRRAHRRGGRDHHARGGTRRARTLRCGLGRGGGRAW